MAHIDRYLQNKFKYRTNNNLIIKPNPTPPSFLPTSNPISQPISKSQGQGIIPSIEQTKPETTKPNIDLKEYYLTTGKKGRRKKNFDGTFQF